MEWYEQSQFIPAANTQLLEEDCDSDCAEALKPINPDLFVAINNYSSSEQET